MAVRFGDYELDADRFELRRAGKSVPIERRIFDLIQYLAANSLRVVPKAELLDQVWKGRHVADGSLSVAISAARRAVGDDASRQRVIRTCRGRGYQFVLKCEIDGVASGTSRKNSCPSALQQSDLVGRAREIDALSQAVEGATRKTSSLAILSGEPGIGKTRLLDELAGVAERLGAIAIMGRCAESGDAPAMWPWSQIFRALLERRGCEWATRVSPRNLNSLAMIMPETLPEAANTSLPLESAETARFQLFDGLVSCLVQLLGDEPAVIAIDDLHRADESSLRFLRFAVRELRHAPIAFLGSHRTAELRHAPSRARILADLVREPHALSLPLEGLSPCETTQLFRGLCAANAATHEEGQLYLQTGGNPFFIRQIATLVSSGTNSIGDEGNTFLAPTLRLAILEQITGLSENGKTVLSAAAVAGREFTLQTLAHVVQLDRLQFEAALDELLDAQVLRRDIHDPGKVGFAHVLVRDALYEHLGCSERRALHDRTGRALASRGSHGASSHTAEIAHHLFEAGTTESLLEARALSEAAGEAAALRSAHDDAGRHYLRALDALRLTDASNEEERCRLLLALGTAQCRSGDRASAKATFADAAFIARSRGATENLAIAALGVAPGFLAAEAGASDAFLEELLAEALACANAVAPSLRARIAARLAMMLHWSGTRSRMLEVISLAREIADRTNDPVTRLHVLVARWFCEWDHNAFDERSTLSTEIYACAELIHDREMTLMGMMLRQVAMLERGEIWAFDASLDSFSSLASELGQPQSLWYTPLYRSMRALFDGNTDRASSLQSELAAVAARVEDANAFHSLVAQASILSWELGNLDGAITGLVEGARRYPTISGFRAAVAWAYAKTGRISDAEREFAILARNCFADLCERFDWPTAVALCAEVSCDLRDRQRSSSLYQLLEPLSTRFLWIGLGVASFGSADRLLGRLSETVGQIERAEAHYRVALERNAAAGAHAWTAHTKLDYALLLARAGGASRRDFRVRLASEALETANDLGMVSLRARAESFLQGSGMESVGRSPS